MLILISQLIGRPVVAFDGAEPLGNLRDPIIDPDNGKLVGYFFGHGLWHLKHSVLVADDIASYDQQRVIVNKEDVIRKVEEEPKIREIIKKKTPIFSAKVLTESGQYLGRANDLLLDTELHMIVKYYVHGLMRDRIIGAEHVVTIDKRGIIVNDAAPSAATAPAEAA